MEKALQGGVCNLRSSAEWSRFYTRGSVSVSVVFVLYKMDSLPPREILLDFSWQESHISSGRLMLNQAFPDKREKKLKRMLL